MGANESSHRSKELDEAVRCFDSGELGKWKRTFQEIYQGSPSKKKREGFNENQLSDYTKDILPVVLQKRLMAIFVKIGSMLSREPWKDFVEWELFIIGISHLIKSGLDEKSRMLTMLCGRSDDRVDKAQLAETLNDLVQAYVAAESKSSEYATWRFTSRPDESIRAIVSFFLSDLSFEGQDCVSTDTLSRWMGLHSVMTKMIDVIVYAAFHFEIKRDPDEITNIPWTIPSCDVIDWGKFQTLLTVPTLFLLNYNLPSDYRRQWRLLYTTSTHGESFSTMLKQIAMKGPTVLIIRDEDGHVFGGYNSKNWELSSNFLGDDSCFVFTLSPTVAIYSSTGYNKNYCYLNLNQQTLPNGLGFGGLVQVNDQPVHYFGLWLDSDFGLGSSRGSCSTFNSPRLSLKENFKIHSMEVWAVERISDAVHKAKAAKSILDIDPEARAILEMTGKTRQSEGLREPEPADDD